MKTVQEQVGKVKNESVKVDKRNKPRLKYKVDHRGIVSDVKRMD